MSGGAENLVLELPRALRADTTAIRRTQAKHGARLTSLSLAVARLRQDDAADAGGPHILPAGTG